MKHMTQTTLVKLANRIGMSQAEREARFTIVEDNGTRVQIRLICNLPIAPVETVSPNDIEVVGQPIDELTPEQFQQCSTFSVEYGTRSLELFVTTRIGRIVYAVSVDHGYAYTRPQLIAKYRIVGGVFSEPKQLR